MGKTMDKSSVLYGSNGTVGLNAVNWDVIKKAILDEVGDEPIGTALAGAKSAVNEAKKDKNLQKAYVKVGLVGSDLVLRIKDVRTVVDKEIDTVLVKQFPQKKSAHDKMVALAGKTNGDKGTVVSLDPKDSTIKTSAQSIANDRTLGEDGPLQRNGQSYGAKDDKHTGTVVEDQKFKAEAFSGANNAPIVLLAHGTPLGKVGSGRVVASHFADKKPADIIAYLKKSLPVTYSGVVYLDGCYTAAGNSPLNYAKQVYEGLVKSGYFYLQVKGNLGMARTVNGKECVTPAEIETAYSDAKKEVDRLQKTVIPALEKPYNDEYAGIIQKLKALQQEAKNGGRTNFDQYNEEEKRRQKALMDQQLNLASRKEKDTKLTEAKKRVTDLNAIVNAPQYNIEALTGTWGPEKLPPKTA